MAHKPTLGLFFEKSFDRLPTELVLIDMLHAHFHCNVFDASKLHDNGYVRAFIDENDILLPHLFSIRAASHSKKWGDYRYYTPNYRELIIHGARVLEILHDCSKPVCCFNVRSDWYPETKAFWEAIPKNAYIFGGIQRAYINETPEPEFFFGDMDINPTLGNSYFDDSRIIPIRHVLSDKELHVSVRRKNYDFSVLGVFYARRKSVYESAKKMRKIRLYNPWLLHKLRKALNRHHKRSYWSNALLNMLFNDALRRSRVSYTDGSHLDIFVRKYLEIPANHALLLCAPFCGMQDFGFVENVHYVRCDEEHLAEQLPDLLADSARCETIVQNSLALVKEFFCPAKVAAQLLTLFSQMSEGSFAGCYYDKGELCFGKRAEQEARDA